MQGFQGEIIQQFISVPETTVSYPETIIVGLF
jgi:hypothetical protein